MDAQNLVEELGKTKPPIYHIREGTYIKCSLCNTVWYNWKWNNAQDKDSHKKNCIWRLAIELIAYLEEQKEGNYERQRAT